ncbi:MAG: glycoside hydrolase family 57 protein [Candidatus Omnitrophica bacterium]|nr:glycoside hydrolase family 57 protein [Candidatus Omnitrophota bacterium]
MEKPLYIAFIWHMHQPYYKDPLSGEISMPWVRLHGVKDYLNMVELLRPFPNIRQTFNLVPSLIDQIEDYTSEGFPNERYLNISLKPAQELNDEDKKFILLNFFMANWANMIAPFSRFYDLLLKRGKFISPALADRVIKNFKPQDYLDIQVLFNLSWFDPYFRNNDPQLKELTAKAAKFSEEDKALVIKKQIEILKKVMPAYKDAQDRGQIEVSVSPYYHPILPLLCDTNSAETGMPHERMPERRFSHPDDARWQVSNAIARYEAVFKKRPNGMWPSEGSVSEAILPIIIENGIKWIATDEGILLKSVSKSKTAEVLYRPYILKRGEGEVNIIFRDHGFSDAIGFIYQNVPAAQAVNDFISHLHRIRESLKGAKKGSFLVPVILDGENAWEYYPNNGRDLLSLLYLRLSEEEPLLKATTVSDFLNENPSTEKIEWLYPGSWINSNFSIWIGQEEKNLSWDYLSAARDDLAGYQRAHPESANEENLKKAWKEIYIAEGSDWNWWYGPQNSSANDAEFDNIYRRHLSNVYKLIGQQPPERLKMPIISKAARPVRSARGLLSPVIDGLDTTYYEWLEAACFDVATTGGTMHRAQSVIKNICCGFDLHNLYIKVDLKLPETFSADKNKLKLVISKIPSPEIRIEIPVFDDKNKLTARLYKRDTEGGWELAGEIDQIAYKKILELAVPFNDLEIGQGREFKLAFFIEEDSVILERQPEQGPISLIAPTVDYESYNWTA